MVYVYIDQCAWTINIWHIIKQILTYDVGQYGFYVVFGNNIDLSFASLNIVASDP